MGQGDKIEELTKGLKALQDAGKGAGGVKDDDDGTGVAPLMLGSVWMQDAPAVVVVGEGARSSYPHASRDSGGRGDRKVRRRYGRSSDVAVAYISRNTSGHFFLVQEFIGAGFLRN